MTKEKVVLSLVFMAVAGAAGFYLFASTPKYALYEIVYAVKTKNRDKFEKRVDVDTIVSRFVDEFAKDLEKRGNNRTGAIAMMLKGKVTEAVHEKINESLFQKEEGAIKDSGGLAGGMMGPLSGVRKELTFKGIGDFTQEGDVSTTQASFFHERFQKDIVLSLKMKKQNGKWRLVEVGGLPQAISDLAKWSAENSPRQVTEEKPQVIVPATEVAPPSN